MKNETIIFLPMLTTPFGFIVSVTWGCFFICSLLTVFNCIFGDEKTRLVVVEMNQTEEKKENEKNEKTEIFLE
jgi:hypothetical protein